MQKPEVILRFLLPPDQYPAESIHPAMSTFHHPAAGSTNSLLFELPRFLTTRADMGRKAKFSQDIADFLIVVARIQTHPLRMLGRRRWALHHQARQRWLRQFHIVAIGPCHRHPQRNAVPFAQQATLNPTFGSVRRVGTCCLTAQRRFGDGAVHAQPGPIEALELIELVDARSPKLQKHVGLDPLLVAVMGSGVRTQLGLIQALPLAARAQHIENSVCAQTVGNAGTSAAKAVDVNLDGQQRL